ncbi:MAG: hypothetical protein ABIH34_01355 [Nanoarchaeota archaeon]
MDAVTLPELERQIATLQWDLSMITNKKVRGIREAQLENLLSKIRNIQGGDPHGQEQRSQESQERSGSTGKDSGYVSP